MGLCTGKVGGVKNEHRVPVVIDCIESAKT